MERINDIFLKEEIIRISLGKRKKNSQNNYTKLKIRPVLIKNIEYYQVESFIKEKVFHTNIKKEDISEYVISQLINNLKEMYIFTTNHDYSIFINKDNKISIKKKTSSIKKTINKSHNIIKNYIIEETDKPKFLIDLGIMDEDFKVKQNSYSKFRQINRFLEILDNDIDIVGNDVKVVDFCCGKGYLTLATSYYLNNIKKIDNSIIGIDLKSDVIVLLNNLKHENVKFYDMDINDYSGGNIDIAIGLHACDTATDISIYNSVKNNAKLIYMVPCCQHELFNMIDNDLLQPLLKYGILKDKMTELLTNTLRGLALEWAGYEVKMIEFTSLEHTMKNVMIKAKYTGKKNNDSLKKYKELEKEFKVKCSVDKIFDIDNKMRN